MSNLNYRRIFMMVPASVMFTPNKHELLTQ